MEEEEIIAVRVTELNRPGLLSFYREYFDNLSDLDYNLIDYITEDVFHNEYRNALNRVTLTHQQFNDIIETSITKNVKDNQPAKLLKRKKT
jgi:heme oxygenase